MPVGVVAAHRPRGIATALSPRDHHNARWQVSVGMPLPHVEIRIADPDACAERPVGEPGEIWFRTTQSMTGYLHRPQATAESLTPDGWLRSGDIGHVDDTGYVYLDDRIKDMIITGGENVYGPEVEQVLLTHPAVRDAAVIGIPDDTWGESVKAVLIAEQPAPSTN